MIYEGELPTDSQVIIDAGFEFIEGLLLFPYTEDDPAAEDTSYLYGLLPALDALASRLDAGALPASQAAQAWRLFDELLAVNCFGQAAPRWPSPGGRMVVASKSPGENGQTGC